VSVLFEYIYFKIQFRPFLTRARREILADYALPVSVLTMSFIGALVFDTVLSE
jgi:sodium borate transporter 11